MTRSCAKRCAATLSSTTSSAYIQRYAIFLRLPLSGSVACNHVSTRAGQDPPPVRAFYLANAGGGGPVNLVLLGGIGTNGDAMSDGVLSGSCLCGAVAYKVRGPFLRFAHCHCGRCRKATGTGHASNIYVDPANFEWVAGREFTK